MNKTNSWVMYIGALMVAMLFSQFTVLGVAIAEEQVETETYVDEEILECSPESQTVSVGETASFSVTALVNGQNRYYIWDAPDGTPNEAEGQGLDEFETVFDEAGEYEVKVYSMEYGNDASTCEVIVEAEEEDISTVKVCKIDEEENPLSGWTLILNDGLPGGEGDFSGVSGENGCVTFDDIPYGHREVFEVNKEGWEYVSGQGDVTVDEPNETFYVVNKLIDDNEEQPTPQCSDDADNADPEDTLIDELDPGCHSDGNALNAESYVPTDNDETDETNGGGGDTDTQCEDGVDNTDPEDTLIDELDPGCHTDGNAGNETSYDPNDNDETDETDGTGDGGDFPECADGIDNADPEDTLIDENDPGCHGDGDVGNPNSYNASDNDEGDANDNESSGGGGGGSRRSSNNNNDGEVLGAEDSCGIYVEKYLRVGHANDPATVMKVQNFLNFYVKSNLVIDGVYGTQTEAAVKQFQMMQSENVLEPWGIQEATGIFYLTTQTEVNNILCPSLGLDIPSPLINWSANASVVLPPLAMV